MTARPPGWRTWALAIASASRWWRTRATSSSRRGGLTGLETQGEYGWYEQPRWEWLYRRRYRFTLQPRQLKDFEGMSRSPPTSPKSSFTRSRICTLAVPGGRLTLADPRFIVTLDGKRTEREVSKGEEYEGKLSAICFGLTWGFRSEKRPVEEAFYDGR